VPIVRVRLTSSMYRAPIYSRWLRPGPYERNAEVPTPQV
jgi:hypothetical protein